MLICGSGSGIRDPLKTNSRGKALVFRVVVAIFLFSKFIVDEVIAMPVTMMKSSDVVVRLRMPRSARHFKIGG